MIDYSAKKNMPFYIGVVVLVFVLLVALGKSAIVGRSGYPDRTTYQAVFLLNGQVYFGKLHSIYSRYPVLTSIYYLQQNQNPQEGGDEKKPPLSLVKLGNEIHGPEDRMYLVKDQILFWENLRPDSQVMQAINSALAQAAAQVTGAQTPPATEAAEKSAN